MTRTDFQRTEFATGLLRHLLRDRALREAGDAGARVSPLFERWTDGLHPRLQDAAEQLTHQGLRLHDYAHAVNSSMVFGFNLWLPFVLGGTGPLSVFLAEATGRELSVTGIEFEFQGPTGVLAECAGAAPGDEEKFTAADVALFVLDPKGKRGVVLIEVKLTEGGFTRCNGATSRANRRPEVCTSSEVFFSDPSACYLTRTRHAERDRRYWTIFERAHGSVRAAFPHAPVGECPFRRDFQQPMRNHALALGLVQAGEADFVHYGLIHHDQNPDVVTIWDEYAGVLAEAGILFRCPASKIVAAGEQLGSGWGDWANYMRERYRLG